MNKDFLTAFAIYSVIGLQLALSVVLGWWLGSKLDAYLHTSPWLGLGGLLLGSIAGFVTLFRLIALRNRENSPPPD